MSELKVPFGLDENARLWSPDEVTDRENAVNCPACGWRLVWHDCTQKAKHFAHKANADCSQESIEHATAKHLMARRLRESVLGPDVRFTATCASPGCGARRSSAHRLSHGDQVFVERTLKSGRIADVAVDRLGGTVLVVEILKTHAVDANKAADLAGIPWFEVKAGHVLDPSSRCWDLTQDFFFDAWTCTECRDAKRELFDKLKELTEARTTLHGIMGQRKDETRQLAETRRQRVQAGRALAELKRTVEAHGLFLDVEALRLEYSKLTADVDRLRRAEETLDTEGQKQRIEAEVEALVRQRCTLDSKCANRRAELDKLNSDVIDAKLLHRQRRSAALAAAHAPTPAEKSARGLDPDTEDWWDPRHNRSVRNVSVRMRIDDETGELILSGWRDDKWVFEVVAAKVGPCPPGGGSRTAAVLGLRAYAPTDEVRQALARVMLAVAVRGGEWLNPPLRGPGSLYTGDPADVEGVNGQRRRRQQPPRSSNGAAV